MRQPIWPGLTLALLLCGGSAAAAQQRETFATGMRTGVGYTAAYPEVLAGAGAWRMLSPLPLGVFADFKTSIGSLRDDEYYCPPALATCTAAWVEENANYAYIREAFEYRIANLGLMYPLTPEFMLLAGAGIARVSSVTEYYDEAAEPVTEYGQLFVDGAEPSWKPQVVVGMMMRAGNRLAVRFGYESAPGGMSIGLYLVP